MNTHKIIVDTKDDLELELMDYLKFDLDIEIEDEYVREVDKPYVIELELTRLEAELIAAAFADEDLTIEGI
jgi:hypothetical protein